jgi:hypothetical protein
MYVKKSLFHKLFVIYYPSIINYKDNIMRLRNADYNKNKLNVRNNNIYLN